MTEPGHDLPDGMVEWVAEAGGGEIVHLERHVARREAWTVDVRRPDGSVLESFLRLQGEANFLDPRRLERETRIIQVFGERGIPSPKVHGWNADLRIFHKFIGKIGAGKGKLTGALQERDEKFGDYRTKKE